MTPRPTDEPFVEELMELIRHRIVNGPNGPLPPNAVITKELHFDQKKVAKANRAKLEDWHLLQEEVAGKLFSHFKDEDETRMHDVRRSLSRLVHQELRNKRNLRYSGTVTQDLKIMLYDHHLDQNDQVLAEHLLTAYKAGGLPCGWLGKYPKGRLIVYWPYDEEPTFEPGTE